jgi:hypothetical protein
MPLFDRKQAGSGSFASAHQRPTHILNKWSLTAVAHAKAVVALSTGRGHSSPLPRRLNERALTAITARKRPFRYPPTSRHSCADKRTTEEVVQLSPTLRYPSAIAVAVAVAVST